MIKVGLIGCGYWGGNHLKVLSEMEGISLRYVSDLIKPKIKIPEGTKFVEDYKEILKDSGIDAVIICTPTATHYPLTKEFLEAGKHVFVEKPITTKSESAKELCEIAKEKKVQLMAGEIFRFNKALTYIKDLINRGELGELRYIETRRVGLGPIRTDVSVLWDLATHDIYISNLIVGKSPESVSYFGISHNGQVDDIVSLNLKYKNPNILSTIYVNWEHPIKERKIFFGGTKKAVLFDDVEPSDKVRIYDKGVDYQSKTGEFGDVIASTRDGDIIIPKLKLTQPLEEELKNFVACIQGNGACLSSGLMGFETVKILEAAEESRLNNGMEVEIK